MKRGKTRPLPSLIKNSTVHIDGEETNSDEKRVLSKWGQCSSSGRVVYWRSKWVRPRGAAVCVWTYAYMRAYLLGMVRGKTRSVGTAAGARCFLARWELQRIKPDRCARARTEEERVVVRWWTDIQWGRERGTHVPAYRARAPPPSTINVDSIHTGINYTTTVRGRARVCMKKPTFAERQPSKS